MAAKGRQRKGPPPRRQGNGRRRLWVVVFAAVLVALFVIFAVAQGIGAPSVPSGDAAIVSSVPSDANSVSEAEVKRATAQQIAAAASESKQKAPKPGSKKYEELREAALGELLDYIWLKGQAEELGISVTPKQIETELKTIKKTNFPTPKAYEEFLEKSHFTQDDVDKRVELQILSTEIQQQVQTQSPPASAEEIQDYFEKEKATQFTTPASRDVRIIVNKDKSKVEAANAALEADQSAKNWLKVAAKYSSDPTTKATGGLQRGITEEFVKGELKKAIFETPTGQLAGPVDFEKNFILVEPVKVTPEKVKKLPEVRSQISQTLSQQKQEKFFSEFVTEYQTKWTSRTRCASGFEIERCSNYPAKKSLEKSREAYAACFKGESELSRKEKKAREAGCPAPVTMNTPTIPGKVTEENPEGERLVQRPQPVGLASAKPKEVELPEGIPPTEAPPTEAPTGE